MNDIIYVAEHAKEIMAAQDIDCHVCDQHQYAPFDKLYTVAYGECMDHSVDIPDDVFKLRTDNIMALI